MNEAVVVMKTGLSLLISVALLRMTRVGATEPLVVRCMGENMSTWGDSFSQDIQTRIDVVIPETLDRHLTTSSRKGELLDFVDPWPVGVGIGEIEITLSLGDYYSTSSRSKFIVTQIPDSEHALIGFYKMDSDIQTLRAELWKKDKPFVFFDVTHIRVVSGHCR